jgi:hypothetical protein
MWKPKEERRTGEIGSDFVWQDLREREEPRGQGVLSLPRSHLFKKSAEKDQTNRFLGVCGS